MVEQEEGVVGLYLPYWAVYGMRALRSQMAGSS